MSEQLKAPVKPVTPAPKPEGANHGDDNASTQFDIATAFFGTESKAAKKPQEDAGNEADEGSEAGAGTDAGGAEEPDFNEPDDGAEDAGNAGAGEGEDADQWEFDGQQYSNDQIADALKQRGTYERFNQTIAPLIEKIKGYGDINTRLATMAQTETEKEIAELTRHLQSGKLDSREYQQAHMQLTRAQQRQEILNSAAQQEKQQRAEALNEARTHNARLVAVNLFKSGWSKDDLNNAQTVAQEFMTQEQFADCVSVGFMELLKDAYQTRSQRKKVADELAAKGKKAVKVNKTGQAAPVKTKKGSGAGSAEWIEKHIWGR